MKLGFIFENSSRFLDIFNTSADFEILVSRGDCSSEKAFTMYIVFILATCFTFDIFNTKSVKKF